MWFVYEKVHNKKNGFAWFLVSCSMLQHVACVVAVVWINRKYIYIYIYIYIWDLFLYKKYIYIYIYVCWCLIAQLSVKKWAPVVLQVPSLGTFWFFWVLGRSVWVPSQGSWAVPRGCAPSVAGWSSAYLAWPWALWWSSSTVSFRTLSGEPLSYVLYRYVHKKTNLKRE